MTPLRTYLLVSTLVIFAVSIYVVATAGVNWPAVYFGDLIQLDDWRSQFNTDFLLHLGLLATWITWREGLTAKGWLFGVLSIFMGGMFSLPYLLLATYPGTRRSEGAAAGRARRQKGFLTTLSPA